MQGTIRSMKADKGFGFIRGTDGKEYFFHRSGFTGHWNDLVDDFDRKLPPVEVRFKVVPSDKGPRAELVERMD